MYLLKVMDPLSGPTVPNSPFICTQRYLPHSHTKIAPELCLAVQSAGGPSLAVLLPLSHLMPDWFQPREGEGNQEERAELTPRPTSTARRWEQRRRGRRDRGRRSRLRLLAQEDAWGCWTSTPSSAVAEGNGGGELHGARRRRPAGYEAHSGTGANQRSEQSPAEATIASRLLPTSSSPADLPQPSLPPECCPAW
jgi:hypothetical protein